jgi:hypothetical protein
VRLGPTAYFSRSVDPDQSGRPAPPAMTAIRGGGSNLPLDQTKHLINSGVQPGRELAAKGPGCADLDSDHHHLRHGPALEHDGKHRRELGDPDLMHAPARLRSVEVVQSKPVDAPDPARPSHRVDDQRLAAVLEIVDRAQARNPGLEVPDMWRQAALPAEAVEHMNPDSIVSVPGIPKTYDVQHRDEDPHQG